MLEVQIGGIISDSSTSSHTEGTVFTVQHGSGELTVVTCRLL